MYCINWQTVTHYARAGAMHVMLSSQNSLMRTCLAKKVIYSLPQLIIVVEESSI